MQPSAGGQETLAGIDKSIKHWLSVLAYGEKVVTRAKDNLLKLRTERLKLKET